MTTFGHIKILESDLPTGVLMTNIVTKARVRILLPFCSSKTTLLLGLLRGSARHSGICLALDQPRGTAHVVRLKDQAGPYSRAHESG